VKTKLLELGSIFSFHRQQLHTLEMSLYDQQRQKNLNSNASQLTPIGSLLAGSLSGIASSCAIFPIDVVRKRMQVMGQLPKTSMSAIMYTREGPIIPIDANINGKTTRTTSIQLARDIFRKEGIGGFYRGLAPELLKVCPMVAIVFCSYEIIHDALNAEYL
jgi:hypothetical protein